MSTTAEMVDAVSTAIVEISEGRIQRWQEGDKRGEFHRIDHLANALKAIKKLEEIEEAEQQTVAVGVVC